jgi:hypothetical protein
MFLEQRLTVHTPSQFNLPTNTILGTTQRWPIDRTWPIEEILITLNFDVTTAFTTVASTTPDTYDNLPALLARVNLSINDGIKPRSVVDSSGMGLLEYVSQAGWNIDQATATAVAIGNNATGAGAVPVGVYQICYRIPCAPQQVAEGLRSRLYLPVHRYPQDPVLTLQFNSIANIINNGTAGTGVIGTVRVDVMLVRRVPTVDSEKLLASTAGSNPSGYIDWDLIETPYAVPLGTNGEFRCALPVPGNYIDLLFRQYKGGTNYSRTVPIDNDVGDTIAHNLGLETKWTLETGKTIVREWTWKHLRILNEFTKPQTALWVSPLTPFVAGASAGSPTSALLAYPANFPTSPQSATANFRAGTSTMLSFLTDGITGDSGNELGSLLDCNTPANNGLKMEVVGKPASVATCPSLLYIMGRRFFGDISLWQKF